MSRITIVHLNEKFFEELAEHAEILKNLDDSLLSLGEKP